MKKNSDIHQSTVKRSLLSSSFNFSFMVDIVPSYFHVQDCIKTTGMLFISKGENK